MFKAIRRQTWNAAPDPNIVLDSVSVKQDEPEEPKQDRGESLMQGLMDGTADCAICHEEITAEMQVWSCKTCHHILHFRCVKRWAEKKDTFTWPCPTCKTLQIGKASNMVPSCWCGRQLQENITNMGNTCGAICFKPNECNSNPTAPCLSNCSKVCHPGPCEPAVCHDWCPSQRDKPFGRTSATANMSPVEYYRQMNRAERQEAASSLHPASGNRGVASSVGAGRPALGQDQPSDSDKKDAEMFIGVSVFLFILELILQIPLLYWMISRIEWWTKPLKYTHFTEHSRSRDSTAAIAVAVIYTIFGSIVPFLWAILLCQTLPGTFRRFRARGCTKFLVVSFSIILILGIFSDILTVTTAGVDVTWHKQMKNSCQGFDTRVKMDASADYRSPTLPKTTLSLYTPDVEEQPLRQIGIDEFKMLRSVDLGKLQSDPWYSNYRLRGTLSPDIHLAVDFDLHKHLWRIMNLTYAPSPGAAFNASAPPPGTTESLFKEGTWTQTNLTSPHVLLPELSLQIPNFHYFTKNCVYQAFMKVYSTANLTSAEIASQGTREWSPKNEKEVVMRTAAFGHTPDGLAVCARKGDYEVNGVGMKGLREDIVVPLGLMAALRLQMQADGKIKDGCHFTS